MKTLVAVFGVLCLAVYACNAASMTKDEFVEMIQPFASDIAVTDSDDVDETDDVIELPGDKLDMEYLVQEIELLESLKEAMENEGDVAGNPCSCSGTRCQCCASKRFSAKIVWHRVSFNLRVCVTVEYLVANKGFKLVISLNGRNVYNKEVSVRNPPPLCYGVPGLKRFSRVCVSIYNVNLSNKSFCLKVTGVLDLKIKKFSVSLPLGCPKIPIAETDADLYRNLY